MGVMKDIAHIAGHGKECVRLGSLFSQLAPWEPQNPNQEIEPGHQMPLNFLVQKNFVFQAKSSHFCSQRFLKQFRRCTLTPILPEIPPAHNPLKS